MRENPQYTAIIDEVARANPSPRRVCQTVIIPAAHPGYEDMVRDIPDAIPATGPEGLGLIWTAELWRASVIVTSPDHVRDYRRHQDTSPDTPWDGGVLHSIVGWPDLGLWEKLRPAASWTEDNRGVLGRIDDVVIYETHHHDQPSVTWHYTLCHKDGDGERYVYNQADLRGEIAASAWRHVHRFGHDLSASSITLAEAVAEAGRRMGKPAVDPAQLMACKTCPTIPQQ